MILFQGDIDYATGHGVVKLGDKVVLTTVKTKYHMCVSSVKHILHVV